MHRMIVSALAFALSISSAKATEAGNGFENTPIDRMWSYVIDSAGSSFAAERNCGVGGRTFVHFADLIEEFLPEPGQRKAAWQLFYNEFDLLTAGKPPCDRAEADRQYRDYLSESVILLEKVKASR